MGIETLKPTKSGRMVRKTLREKIEESKRLKREEQRRKQKNNNS